MTISDIAKLAGVSVATVSRVINNKGYVKQETRKRIEALIDENDYRPNAVAQSLTRNKTAIIAVIISNRLNPFFSSILDAVEKKATEDGYNILFCTTMEDNAREYKAIAQAIELRVTGILLLPVLEPDGRSVKLLEEAERSGIPVVLVDRDQKGGDFDIVYVDNKKVIYEGMELLVKSGHRKIAFLRCPEVLRDGKNKYDGYIKCLEDYKIPIRDDYVISTDYSEKSGYKACEKIIKLSDPPTAIFSSCSSATLGCMRYASENNLQWGKDMGLIGFDDISLLATLGYEITMLERPTWEMAETAYEILQERMEKSNKQHRRREILSQTRLIVRGSEKADTIGGNL